MSFARVLPSGPLRPARAAFALLVLALLFPAGAGAAGAVSSNWAGWVARPSAGKALQSVSGTWTEPTVSCTAGQASYSAIWVGLGGYSRNSRALEQIGTDSDCTRGGRAVYSSWVELLPAGPRALSVAVHPGDEITAAVTVHGRDATLGLRDLSTGAAVSRTVRLKAKDVSSAEWIVEAPSDCSASCHTLPLADFGTVAFSAASATVGSVTSALASGPWSSTSLELRGRRAYSAAGSSEASPALVVARPSPAGTGGAFTVSYSERHGGRLPSGPVLPGGGP